VTAQTHCVCLSGLTPQQEAILELRGMLQLVEGKCFEVIAAHSGPGELGNPEVVAYIERLQVGLCRAEDFCRVHGWRGRASEGVAP
jgi:hypothetical protein